VTTGRRRAGFWIAGVLLALVIAGGASHYASSSPDGLQRTAADTGFAHTARDSAAADSPLAEYTVSGVDDDRLSGGLAGVIGVAVVLVLAGGLTLLVRRRNGEPADADADPAAPGRSPA
jgi:cobalt/nickel transport protein